MLIPKRTTWFLIADSAKARVIESAGPQGDWMLIGQWSDGDARAPSRALGRDRPARGRTIGTGAPFAIEGVSEHEKAGEAFLTERAHYLNAAHLEGKFDQLVIAAAPSALGFLRKKLHVDVTGKLISVLDKDLTNETDSDLHAYFLDKLERW